MKPRQRKIARSSSAAAASRSVVVIGSYREDLPGLLAFSQGLLRYGLHVLHPVLPSDKTGLLGQFGESTYYFHKSYSHARIAEILLWPPKRERIERKEDDLQVGVLADDLARSLRSDNAPSEPAAP